MQNRIIKKQFTYANRYSYTRLALNFYLYYDMVRAEEELPEEFLEYQKELTRLMDDFYQYRYDLQALDHLRNQVIHTMEILTAYADCFQIYESVLNRMERRFFTGEKFEDTEQEFVDQLMHYLTSDRDSMTVNQRVQMIIAELPIRFTRSKFYELVLNGLTVYIGSEKKSLDDILYILRTESMVCLPPDMERCQPKLFHILSEFHRLDYKKMTKQAYENAVCQLQDACEQLIKESELYLLMQDIINDFYVLLLTSDEAVVNVAETETLTLIVQGILGLCSSGSRAHPDESITDQLTLLEGHQESSYERYLRADSACENFKNPEDEMGKKLIMLDKLISNSPFVSLSDKVEENEIVDKKILLQTVKEYETQLDQVFAGCKKPVVRSIMAKVLSRIPVFFHSVDEIREYTRRSLESCSDSNEKETCIELLKELMESENAME